MMQSVPDTRPSLIRRLHDLSDDHAWRQFVEIYEPLVYELARRKGVQHADAIEICQDIMFSVATTVERFDFERRDGRFRDWLFIIARNRVINFLNNRRANRMKSGGSELLKLLKTVPDTSPEESNGFDIEYRRRLFRWAATKVRSRTEKKTWSAFWATAIEKRPATEVADQLGMSVGAVYIAKSRVMDRIKTHVAQFQFSENF